VISEQTALWKKRLERLNQAREALHAAGPRIAEFLVQAINAKAQRIYGALCPQDPGQLSWQPDYELRVVGAGGARRFASLSGGQKALAALAIQIALVQQFSRCGICVFDEPTFGLDSASRARLAQAVLEAQSAANFEQLFVVSHDDAFDGYVEHSVFLEYSPLAGTAAG
jgi:exonuclease SbcC